MNRNMPGLPVHHQILEFTQPHVHWIGDAIQPTHPLSTLLLLPSVFPSISIFSNEWALLIRWPKYWSFSFNISPYNEHLGLTSFRMDCKEIQPVHPKGDQPWIFIGRTDAEAETETELTHLRRLWCWEILKQEEKGITEDEMVAWNHRLNGHEFE